MTTHYYPFPHGVTGGEASTTSRKGVTCETCLSLIGPDPEQLDGYHFPATKWANTPEHDSISQLKHIEQEFDEFSEAELCTEHELLEAWDLIHSVETWLRIRAKEGADVEAAKRAVYEKNRVRNYYAK